jgi:hypothetical protein
MDRNEIDLFQLVFVVGAFVWRRTEKKKRNVCVIRIAGNSTEIRIECVCSRGV